MHITCAELLQTVCVVAEEVELVLLHHAPVVHALDVVGVDALIPHDDMDAAVGLVEVHLAVLAPDGQQQVGVDHVGQVVECGGVGLQRGEHDLGHLKDLLVGNGIKADGNGLGLTGGQDNRQVVLLLALGHQTVKAVDDIDAAVLQAHFSQLLLQRLQGKSFAHLDDLHAYLHALVCIHEIGDVIIAGQLVLIQRGQSFGHPHSQVVIAELHKFALQAVSLDHSSGRQPAQIACLSALRPVVSVGKSRTGQRSQQADHKKNCCQFFHA